MQRKSRCKAPRCREPALPYKAFCSPECGAIIGVALLEKQKRKEDKKRSLAAKAEKAGDRAKREAMKGVPELTREAQEAFNRYVRLRDNGKGCFVCGVTLRMGGVGGGFDAGHIRARSQASHLRFDERNVQGECKSCNAAGSTKDHEMRAAAERLLGKEAADALYADNRVHKWQRDELRAIRDTYRAKARDLEKGVRVSPSSHPRQDGQN